MHNLTACFDNLLQWLQLEFAQRVERPGIAYLTVMGMEALLSLSRSCSLAPLLITT